jgi:hypothetical protein
MAQSETLSTLPDNRTELQKLQEFIQKGGNVRGLPDKWKDMWNRILVVDGIIRQWPSSKDQLRVMREHPELSEMSRTQLWRYRDATQELIGFTESSKKKYQRLIANEMLQKGFDMATAMYEAEEHAAASRLWGDMLKQYIKLHALDVHDDDGASAPEPNANLLVMVVDGKPRTIDLNNPADLGEDVRQMVVNAIFQDQTPTSPEFITDATFEELPDKPAAAE